MLNLLSICVCVRSAAGLWVHVGELCPGEEGPQTAQLPEVPALIPSAARSPPADPPPHPGWRLHWTGQSMTHSFLYNDTIIAHDLLCSDVSSLIPCFFFFPLSQCMLEKVGNWNFDIFLFDRLTNGRSNMMKEVELKVVMTEVIQCWQGYPVLNQPWIECVTNGAIYWMLADTEDLLYHDYLYYKSLNFILKKRKRIRESCCLWFVLLSFAFGRVHNNILAIFPMQWSNHCSIDSKPRLTTIQCHHQVKGTVAIHSQVTSICWLHLQSALMETQRWTCTFSPLFRHLNNS